MVTITAEKVHRLQQELTKHWHKGRKTFTIMEGVKLLGLFENWAETSVWVRFMYHALRISVNNALRTSRQGVLTSKAVTDMTKAIVSAPNATDAELQTLFLQKKIAKDIYHSKIKIHINKTMKRELFFLGHVLRHPAEFNLSTPIAHLVTRTPDFQTFGDACLDAAGGYADNPGFWWHLQFPAWVRAKTLRHYQVMVQQQCEATMVTINVLEFLTEIINYATLTVYVKSHPLVAGHEYPVLLN